MAASEPALPDAGAASTPEPAVHGVATAATPEPVFHDTGSGCVPLLDTLGTEDADSRDRASLVAAFHSAVSRDEYLILESPPQVWLPQPWADPIRADIAASYRLVQTIRLSPGPPLFIYRRDAATASPG